MMQDTIRGDDRLRSSGLGVLGCDIGDTPWSCVQIIIIAAGGEGEGL